jgi:hypothetical protein
MRRFCFVWACLLVLFSSASGQETSTKRTRFTGICDASAAVRIKEDLVAIADDEDNSMRVYSVVQGGKPVFVRNLSGFLAADPQSPEADIEAGARIGVRIYWITSHGRNSTGKYRRNRGQFFATLIEETDGAVSLEPLGTPYRQLLGDMYTNPMLASLNLETAALRPPKDPGAVNIEGLAATPEGHLLIGFRNPIPKGRAVLIPLLNPAELLVSKPARFGAPILLDLGGLGIRSIAAVANGYVIIAGNFDGGGKPHLYHWIGVGQEPVLVKGIDRAGLNLEAVTEFGGSADALGLFMTSDDGTKQVGGRPCKTLKDPDQKSFRGIVCLNLTAFDFVEKD